MRDLFRLIAVAAMSFAVVGLAMLYSRGDDLTGALRDAGYSVASLVGAPGATPPLSEPVTDTKTVTLLRPDPTRWMGLSGLPDKTDIAFPLPRDHAFAEGALALQFDTELAKGGDGLMTLSVNGTPRGQVVLESGQASHSVRIALSQADLSGDEVVLQMAARGSTGTEQTCAVNAASAVTLRPESGLELALPKDDPLAGAALEAATRPLALVAGTGVDDAALTAWAAQRLDRAGLNVRLGAAAQFDLPVRLGADQAEDEGLRLDNGAAVTQLIGSIGREAGLPAAFPASLADLGADTEFKTFRGSRQWAVDFAIADLPGGQRPQGLALKLATVPLDSGDNWMARVTLNGDLLAARRLPGKTTSIALDVDLPLERLLPRNRLSIELVASSARLTACGQAEQVGAQLLPESALVDPVASTGNDWAGLVEQLAGAESVALTGAAGLNASQLAKASDMLGMLLPRAVVTAGAEDGAVRIAVADRTTLAQEMTRLGTDSVAVVVPLHDGRGAPFAVLPLPSAEFGSALNRLEADDAILLVSRP